MHYFDQVPLQEKIAISQEIVAQITFVEETDWCLLQCKSTEKHKSLARTNEGKKTHGTDEITTVHTLI